MNVRNCRKCGKMFNYVSGQVICPRCKEELEEKFQEVKAYVQDNRGADIVEVSEKCEVEPSQIRQWIREERLQFAEDSAIMIACESCGAMIRSGRYCDKCKNQLGKDLANAAGLNQPKKETVAERKNSDSRQNKMRYL